MRRKLRSTAAKAFVIALAGMLMVPSLQVCAMPMTDVSMAYGSADMSEACAGLTKQACLISYIQADRVTASSSATISAGPTSVLHVAPPLLLTLRSLAEDAPTAIEAH